MAHTIVALATPSGRSGIGVVRLSGADALAIVRSMTAEREGDARFAPRRAVLADLIDPQTGDPLDHALVTYFKAPHSFTGEDVVEISCHGSPVVLRQVVDICLAQGARLAEPGEFSLRALSNGRMDLTEAEAVRDLIDSQTRASARQAVQQLRGEFSHTLQPIKDELLNIIVVLESALEFVEDDLPEAQSEAVVSELGSISAAIGSIARTYSAGHLIRSGLRVALAGRPNVGKSSLFNALLGTERAIVTEIAGTTRDQIRESFVVDDIPISLIDTAGLRQTEDVVESIGVDRARKTVADADLVIVMIDGSEGVVDEDREIIESVKDLRSLMVINKIDLDTQRTGIRGELERLGHRPIEVSAKTGAGLEELKRAIVEPFSPQDISHDGFLVTDARHYDLLLRSSEEIRNSADLLSAGESEEIVLIGLHNALRYLGQVTGETTTEDMLTRIFATFCIGK